MFNLEQEVTHNGKRGTIYSILKTTPWQYKILYKDGTFSGWVPESEISA